MNKTCLIYGTPVRELPFGYDEEDELCVEIKLKIAEVVAQLSASGVTDFITDCEYGILMWGAEIVLAQKLFSPELTLKVYMPHEEQAVKWAPDWRERYFSIHEKADDVVIFNDYKKCLETLCEDADVLIYVGDEEDIVVRRFVEKRKAVQRILF